MQIDVESRPSYGMAVVQLDDGETIIAEAGSMVAMSDDIDVSTEFNGTGGAGFMGKVKAVFAGLARKVLGGESMFVNHFTANGDDQKVMLAPAMVGDVMDIELKKRPVFVQATSFLAATPDVVVQLVWGGWSMLFSGEGAFFLKCRGKGGRLLVNSYGAIEEIQVDGPFVVDSGHLVAYQGKLQYKIKKVGGWKSTLLSGEGLVLEFTGTGRVWLQTRNLSALVGWLTPQLPR
jgi:uncharacterized protein (TIGR00266 family)